MPPIGLGVGLGLGGGKPATSGGAPSPSGPPVPDEVLKTEADDFLMTENDENIEIEE